MIRRSSTLIALLNAVWLFLAPALCSAGVLTHPCDCAEVSEDCGPCCGESEDRDCDCLETGCSHDGCAGDPCSVAVTGRSLGGMPCGAPVVAIAYSRLAELVGVGLSPPGGTSVATSLGPPGLAKRLPYPPSDLPLLV